MNADEYDMKMFIDIVSINPGLHRMRCFPSHSLVRIVISCRFFSFFRFAEIFHVRSIIRSIIRHCIDCSEGLCRKKKAFSAVASNQTYHIYLSLLENLEPEALTGYSGFARCYAFINNMTVSNVTPLLFSRYIDL